MRRFLFPTKDTTIYSDLPSQQTGLDEILEIGKRISGSNVSRAIMDFNIASLSSSIVSGLIPSTASFELKLFIARANDLNLFQKIEACPISESWQEGSGYFAQQNLQIIDGATWLNRSSGSLWINTGSTFITSPTASVTASQPIIDLSFDVTQIVGCWLSGGALPFAPLIGGAIVPNGLVIKFPTADEQNLFNFGQTLVYSKDTHTVFSPVLIAKWDDSIYSTGSFPSASVSNFTVYPSNLRPKYKMGDFTRIDLVARTQYPAKIFSLSGSVWQQNSYLPTSSYYSIVDVQSQEVIVPFDTNSKISIDTNGSFIQFFVEKMYPRRFYKLIFKVINSAGYQYTFDGGYTFTVDV